MVLASTYNLLFLLRTFSPQYPSFLPCRWCWSWMLDIAWMEGCTFYGLGLRSPHILLLHFEPRFIGTLANARRASSFVHSSSTPRFWLDSMIVTTRVTQAVVLKGIRSISLALFAFSSVAVGRRIRTNSCRRGSEGRGPALKGASTGNGRYHRSRRHPTCSRRKCPMVHLPLNEERSRSNHSPFLADVVFDGGYTST